MQLLTNQSIQMQIQNIWRYLKGIRSIRMQVRTIRKGFEVFECKFQPFELDSKLSNVNLNLLNGIRSVWMQILTFERDSKHSNANSNHLKVVLITQKQIRYIRREL